MQLPTVNDIHKRVLFGILAVFAFGGILALAENAQRRVDLATQEQLHAPSR